MWLRPGKKYLFGRVRQDGGETIECDTEAKLTSSVVSHAIQHASISRKHVVIEVTPVKPGDGVWHQPSALSLLTGQSHLYTKSEISVADQTSKYGTTIDGDLIRGQAIRLGGEEHALQLGKYQHALR